MRHRRSLYHPLYHRNSNQEFPELISKLDTNVNDFDSQTLLGLCSGNFTQNDCQNNTKDTEEVSQTNDDYIEDEDNEVLSERKVRKVFNIESDDESEPEVEEEEESEEDFKVQKELKPDFKGDNSLKSINGSDGEELVVSEAEESDGEEEDLNEEDVEKIGKGFFDDEAELSGSD